MGILPMSTTGVPPVSVPLLLCKQKETEEARNHGRDAHETHGQDGHATHARTDGDDMTNREHIQQQLSAYIDGELNAADAAAVEQALAGEPELARELERLKTTRELLRRLPFEHAPEDFASRVLAQTERRHLVHPQTVGRQGINWLRYSLIAAVALIAVSVAMVTVVGIYKAHNPGRIGIAAANAPASSGEALALMDKAGKAASGKDEQLRGIDRQNEGKVEAGEAKDNNILICTDNLAKARTELERELGKNAIQYRSHWAGDEEAVVVADLDSSQVARLDQVISTLRSNNMGAELSGRQVRESRCREQAATGGKGRSALDELKGAEFAAKEMKEPNEAAKKDLSKQGGGWSAAQKIADSKSACAAPGAACNDADGSRRAKDAPPPRTPAKPGATGGALSANGPAARPALENGASPALAENGQCEHAAQRKSPVPAAAPAQNVMATSQAKLNNLRNQSNQFALRVQITLQYHPALTQSFGPTQNRGNGQIDQNSNQTSQSCPAEDPASRPDDAQR